MPIGCVQGNQVAEGRRRLLPSLTTSSIPQVTREKFRSTRREDETNGERLGRLLLSTTEQFGP